MLLGGRNEPEDADLKTSSRESACAEPCKNIIDSMATSSKMSNERPECATDFSDGRKSRLTNDRASEAEPRRDIPLKSSKKSR